MQVSTQVSSIEYRTQFWFRKVSTNYSINPALYLNKINVIMKPNKSGDVNVTMTLNIHRYIVDAQLYSLYIVQVAKLTIIYFKWAW